MFQLNTNGNNDKLLAAILCAALYPNVVKVIQFFIFNRSNQFFIFFYINIIVSVMDFSVANRWVKRGKLMVTTLYRRNYLKTSVSCKNTQNPTVSTRTRKILKWFERHVAPSVISITLLLFYSGTALDWSIFHFEKGLRDFKGFQEEIQGLKDFHGHSVSLCPFMYSWPVLVTMYM